MFSCEHLPATTDARKSDWLPYYKEAQSLEKANRIQEAEQQYQVVLDLCCDSAEGKETVAVATARRDLGRVLALQRKFDRAEEQYKVSSLLRSLAFVLVYVGGTPAQSLLHCSLRLL